MSLGRPAIRGAALTPSGAGPAAVAPWEHRQGLAVSPGSQHHLHPREIFSKSSKKHCWKGCFQHLRPLTQNGFVRNTRMGFHVEENTAGRDNGKVHRRDCKPTGKPISRTQMFSFTWPLIHAYRANSLSLPSHNKTQHFPVATTP